MALSRDLRHSVRSLLAAREFTAITVLTLALGIGANTAVFSVVEGVLLKPLPYERPDRLYRVFMKVPSFPKFPMNPNDFVDFRAGNRTFGSIAVFTESDLQISDPDRPERLKTLHVSKDFLRVLGFRPEVGQDFQANNELKGNERVVLISDALWRRRYNADPSLVGRTILLDEQPYAVIGVLPPGFQHPGADYRSPMHGATVDACVPFVFPTNRRSRGSHFLNAIGRLRDGATPDQASTDLNRIASDLARQYPGYHWRVFLTSLRQEIVGKSERMLLVFLGAVGLVLLIACVNAANLLLARATARYREIAVRAALGATRARIAAQMLTESLTIAIVAGVLGAAIAMGGVRILLAIAPHDFPRAQMIRVDGGVFAFTFLTAVLTGILFGLAPALQAARTDLNDALRESGRGSTAGAGRMNLRSLLVVLEVCLATVLMIGAGLLLRTFVNILRTDPGFQPENVITAKVSLPGARYKDDAATVNFYSGLLARIRALPGVKGAGASSDLPWTGYDENAGFNVEGRSEAENQDNHARYHDATAGFFEAMGIPLIRGRLFDDRDRIGSPSAIVINLACARKFWPGQDPIGRRITFSDKPAEKDWMTVIGVVGDVKDTPTSSAAEPAFWWSHAQVPFGEMILTVRAAGDPRAVESGVRRELANMDKDLAVADMQTMEVVTGDAASTARFALLLMGVFAVVALCLAGIGMYGVLSYSVAQRTHEFGVRMALGAARRDLLVMVTAQGLKLILAGTAAGLALALALARLLSTLVYGVGVRDAMTFATACLVAIVAGALACYAPAHRATQADPMVALRYE